jgi:hypothetical protein
MEAQSTLEERWQALEMGTENGLMRDTLQKAFIK